MFCLLLPVRSVKLKIKSSHVLGLELYIFAEALTKTFQSLQNVFLSLWVYSFIPALERRLKKSSY